MSQCSFHFNWQTCFSIPIFHNLKSIQLCSPIHFTSTIQLSSTLNEFNLCFRYTGYRNHRHGSVGLQAGIYKNKSISEHYRYGLAGLLIGVTHQYNRSQYCYFDPYWYTNLSLMRNKQLTFYQGRSNPL